jgi:DNA-binding transcriptional MerR regulator
MPEIAGSSRRRDQRAAAQAPDLSAGFFDRGAAGRDTFSIRDLTKEFGVSARTLRFYEEKRLLDPRRNGQERLYSRRDRARLRYVLMGKSVGFSLEEVREMLDLYDIGDGQRTQLQVARGKFRERITRLERQKADIDRAVAELTRALRAVETMLGSRGEPEAYDTGTDPAPRGSTSRSNTRRS